MSGTSMVHVRVDDDLKREAATALEAMGLSVSDAVRLLLKRVVADQALPFELKVPNAETRAAVEEARRLSGRFKSGEDLLRDIEEDR